MRRVPLRQNGFDHYEPGSGARGPRDRTEYLAGRRVVPVMQDVGQHIDVRGRHRVEEVAPEDLDTVRETVSPQQLVCVGHDMRQVEDDPAPARVTAEQFG